jgi:hypothetical protein
MRISILNRFQSLLMTKKFRKTQTTMTKCFPDFALNFSIPTIDGFTSQESSWTQFDANFHFEWVSELAEEEKISKYGKTVTKYFPVFAFEVFQFRIVRRSS